MEVKALNNLCAKAYEQKDHVADLDLALKKEKEILLRLQEQVMFVLDETEVEKFQSNHGLVYKVGRESVRVPKTLEDKALFFDWLREKGIYDELITVNSTTLNSLYKEERTKNDDPDFRLPGIGASTISYRLGMRRG